ncbi:MFS general substrate transporter [Hypoxylon trugodes]|uniref:MFS general substrate transporter n=1 Tax=Hypoxylon trugodes TaxID=326681 RepID=UPI0021964010|nr:MFS general substrate transporter [Hypoxylon trugodes]KAI1390080.1 MFS general substrate transporter [Hypoxylon trugodes]
MGFYSQARQFFSGTRKDSACKPPFFLSVRSSTTFILLTVNLAFFTDIFFYGLIVPVIPFSLTVQVGIPEDQVQHWTSILLACYSVAIFVGAPFAGIYADHSSSRRWPLLIGLIALAASTLLLCFGNSIGLLVLGRILQGITAAVVWSAGCALLVDTMQGAAGVAMGYVGISMSVGLLVAPVIGGAVYSAAGYFAVYYIAFGVVLVDILLRLLMVEKKVARQWIDEDESSDSSRTGANQPDVEAAIPPTTPDRANPQNGSEPIETHVSTSEPVSICQSQPQQNEPREKQAEAEDAANQNATTPIEPAGMKRQAMVLLKSPRLLGALFGLLVQASIMLGFDATLALFVQSTFDWNSTAAGILFLALFLPGFLSPLIGWTSDRYGAKWPALFGFCLSVPLLVCLRFVTENTIQHKILLGFLLALLGTSLAFANVPLMAEITYVIEAKMAEQPGVFGKNGAYGLGYGLFNVAWALGGVIGPLWTGYVVNSAGWGTMTWSIAIWAAIGAVVIFIWIGEKGKKSSETDPSQNEGVVNQ